jgi:hypothetical protein
VAAVAERRPQKCDEEREAHGGGCKTCSRLRIQCLGFGERRPNWLRVCAATPAIRWAAADAGDAQDAATRKRVLDTIKAFLNQQGIARGQHPAAADDDDILQLAPGPASTASGTSPRSPASRSPHSFSGSDTSSSDEAPAPHFDLVVSAVRDEPPAYVADYTGHPAGGSPTVVSPGSADLDPSLAALALPVISHGYQPYGGVDQYYAQPPADPALHSSYGASYNSWYTDPLDDVAYASPEALALAPALPPVSDMGYFFVDTDAWTQQLLKHYIGDVVGREYLLADPNVHHLIWKSVLRSPTAYKGAVLLARLDHQSRSDPCESRANLLTALEHEAAGVLAGRPCADDGDAFAALQLVSCFLFLGGRGRWSHYLDLAVDWVRGLLDGSPVDAAETLHRQDEWARFLIKTTMWFDVLGSVTRGQAPRLLLHYRGLYAGVRAVDDGSAPTSMMPVMGCESAIVLALAETSALAAWKDAEEARGRFSAVRLVNAGARIERELLGPAPDAGAAPGEGDATRARRLTSAVFRASARVYLHSVLSGDMPGCPEIAGAVAETVGALRRVPAGDARAERAVVRMVVFSICVAGCMSDDAGTREFLAGRLERQQLEGVGNCAEVRAVMARGWARRAPGQRVRWRDVAAAHGGQDGCLLLV